MKKLNDLGSPRPNEGEGLGGARGEGGDACRIEFQERLKKGSRCGKTNARCGSTAIPLTPQPLSPLGRGEPQSNLISIFSHLPFEGGTQFILVLGVIRGNTAGFPEKAITPR
jgi:hypothetical protein